MTWFSEAARKARKEQRTQAAIDRDRAASKPPEAPVPGTPEVPESPETPPTKGYEAWSALPSSFSPPPAPVVQENPQTLLPPAYESSGQPPTTALSRPRQPPDQEAAAQQIDAPAPGQKGSFNRELRTAGKGLKLPFLHLIPPRPQKISPIGFVQISVATFIGAAVLFGIFAIMWPLHYSAQTGVRIWLGMTAFVFFYVHMAEFTLRKRTAGPFQKSIKVHIRINIGQQRKEALLCKFKANLKDPSRPPDDILLMSRRGLALLIAPMIAALVLFIVALNLIATRGAALHLPAMTAPNVLGLWLLTCFLIWLWWSSFHLLMTEHEVMLVWMFPAYLFWIPGSTNRVEYSEISSCGDQDTFFGNFFGYGTLKVDTPGDKDAAFNDIKGIPHHRTAMDTLSNGLRDFRRQLPIVNR